MGKQTKTERREVRLTERDNDLLVEAAGIVGISVSEFVVEHAVADAEAIVRDHHTIILDPDHHRRFIEALDRAVENRAFTDAVRFARPLKHA